MRIQGGIPVGGNLGTVAARPNPLLDPRFKIQGGEPWNKTPILPKETKEFENRQFNIPQQLPGAINPVGNVGSLVAQINPTYPAGDPRYGQPMQMGGQPMSMSTSEYEWMQGINRLREANPDVYQKIKGMMGPFGWTNPPTGFQVPTGL